MTEFPALAYPDIQRWVGEQSFLRGRSYAQQGAISNPRRQGLTLKAKCQGSQPQPYHVAVTLGDKGVVAGSCSCPVGDDGHCKHVAALLCAWLDAPETFVEVDDPGAALEQLDKHQLVALVRRMVRRSPDLEMVLELEVASLKKPDAAQPVDIQIIQRQIRHSFDLAESSWGSTVSVGQDLQPHLDSAEAYLERGDGQNAAAIYATLARSILDHYEERDDEGRDYDEYYEEERFDDDGQLGVVVDQCVEGLGRCLEAMDEPVERERILEALFDIYNWGINYDGMYEGIATGSDVPSVILERATTEERKYVAALVRDVLPPGSDWVGAYKRQKYAAFLLGLERDELDDEAYLRICRETGLLTELMDRLLALGRIEEATAEARQLDDMKLLSLVDLFISRGQDALIERLIRERAPASQGPALLEWLKKRAREAGNLDGALSLAETLFWRHPSVPGYTELKELAQALGRWDALRAGILSRLERQKQYGVLTEIHLAEGEVDPALETVDHVGQATGGWYGADSLQIRVARAAEESRPEAAIRLYRQEAHRLIAQQGRENYATAARYFQRVRDLYRRLGEGQTWQALISTLREQYRRFRALQDELQKAGLFEVEPEPKPKRDDPGQAPTPGKAVVHLLRSPNSPLGQ
jgi:uncharacterized Zn finger protein